MSAKKPLKTGDVVKFVAEDGVLAVHAGLSGTVTEVGGTPDEPLYSVRLDPWEEVMEDYVDPQGAAKVRVQYKHPKTGAVRGHAADTVGCVPAWAVAK